MLEGEKEEEATKDGLIGWLQQMTHSHWRNDGATEGGAEVCRQSQDDGTSKCEQRRWGLVGVGLGLGQGLGIYRRCVAEWCTGGSGIRVRTREAGRRRELYMGAGVGPMCGPAVRSDRHAVLGEWPKHSPWPRWAGMGPTAIRPCRAWARLNLCAISCSIRLQATWL